jgi:uncharacterized protein YbjT (DUF2867 family)
MSEKTALIIGATGLVGKHCLTLLLDEPGYSKVIALVRKPLGLAHPKLQVQVVNFDRLEDHATVIKADDIFCTIGTTIRHAGSKENFYKVDFTYPYKVAELAVQNGAENYIIITAIGSNPNSRFFYFRVKGELEQALTKLPFKSLHFMRPAWLVGQRAEKRFREEFMVVFSKLLNLVFVGSWRRYRSIKAEDVARAMLIVAASNKTGVNIYKTDVIQSIADGFKPPKSAPPLP